VRAARISPAPWSSTPAAGDELPPTDIAPSPERVAVTTRRPARCGGGPPRAARPRSPARAGAIGPPALSRRPDRNDQADCHRVVSDNHATSITDGDIRHRRTSRSMSAPSRRPCSTRAPAIRNTRGHRHADASDDQRQRCDRRRWGCDDRGQRDRI